MSRDLVPAISNATMRSGGLLAWTLGFGCLSAAEPAFRIEVVEQGSGWPVPLVMLKTTHHLTFVTDNAGLVAVDAAELMGRETYFDISSDGYEAPADGFGFRGVRLTPRSGGSHRIEMQRTMIAKRLGRLTGGGLFGESQKTGRELDWKESGVFGCDSVQTTTHGGRRFWLWGDTTLPQYPLGIFDSSGAVTASQPLRTYEPPVRLQFDYFRDSQGKPRGITPMPGSGPTWATAMVSLPDRAGTSQLVCSYVKIRGYLEEYEWGLAVWNERESKFDRLKVLWTKSETNPVPPSLPRGHAVPWKDAAGKDWVLFAHPFPGLRCPATFEAWQDPSAWESIPHTADLIAAGTGDPVRIHRGVHCGGIGFHPWRRRWVGIFLQVGGKPSPLSELWYAEAESPFGPWGSAVKVLTHQNYSFYNPCLHLDFTPADSPMLLFEGTYTKEFSGNPTPTPRYDYNQILYRLDLDDSRLKPAQTAKQ